MSDTKVLSKNAIYNFSAYITNIIIAFSSIPLFAKYLSPVNFGLYFIFIGLIGYYSIFDFGLSQAVIKFVSKHFAKGEISKINSLITSSILVNFFIGTLACIIVFSLNHLILNLLNVPPESYEVATSSLNYTVVAFLLSAIYSVFISTFQGLLRYDISSKLNIFFSIFSNSVAIILLLLKLSIKDIILNHLIFIIVFMTISIHILKKLLPGFTFEIINIKQTSKKLFKFSFFVFANKLSNIISTNFLQFFISSFYSPAVVPYFMVPIKLVNLIQGATANISNVIFPYSSNLYTNNLIDSIKSLFTRSTNLIVSFTVPLYAFFCFFSYEILSIWMGIEFANKSQIVLVFLTLAYFLSVITIPPTNILYGMGQSRFIGNISIVILPINLLLQVVLIKYYSYNGAAVATTIVSFAGPFFFVYVSFKFFNIRFMEMVKIIPTKILIGLFLLICFLSLKYIFEKFEMINSRYFILGYGVILITLFYSFLLKENKKLIYKIIKR